MEFVNKFLWIDFISSVIFLRICYISFKHGVLNELIKFIGVLIASFVALHHYRSLLGEVFTKKPYSFDRAYLDAVSFVALFLGLMTIAFLVRRLVSIAAGRESYPLWDKLFALAVGVIRACVFISVCVYAAWLNPVTNQAISRSYAYKFFARWAPAMYLGNCKVYRMINPQMKVNKEVLQYYEVKKTL